MPSTSKSNRRKAKTFKFIPKPKQQWQVKVKQQKRNWLELPSDVTANILYRIGVFDILENAQKVCTAWRKICKDPAMWRVIYMDNFSDPNARPPLQEMCKHAVDRSQGQLVDITIVDFANDELLQYIADRSSQLRRLKIACCYGEFYDSCTEVLEKFRLLEELSLYKTDISKEAIETAGRCCPMLKTLKLNQEFYRFWDEDTDDESLTIRNETAIAISQNLRELRHLELIGNSMSNTGLQAILDGCRHLESLDLRQCFYVDLKGDLKEKCCEQIKCLKLPNDSLEGCLYIRGNDRETFDVISNSDDDYHGYLDYDDCSDLDYDDYTAYDNDVGLLYDDDFEFEDLNEMLTFMAMFD